MKKANKIPCRKSFTDTLLQIAQKDKEIIAVTSDASGSATLTDFAQTLPEQFVEVGIAEQNAVGIAAGMASTGKKVFIFGPACFYVARSLEQVKVDLAYSQMPVKICGVSGGVAYSQLGATHHSLHDIAVLRTFPGMEIYLPCDVRQTRKLVERLIDHPKPAYIRVGRNAVPDVYETDDFDFELGKANLLKDGKDLTLIGTGETVAHCLEAALMLEKQGIHARVLDMHTLKPFDRDAVIKASEPFLAVSGGDPILHPDFWRFAEELHRRGIRWIIMGNPFHLTPQVCTRLYQLGCMVYQQSLDGLSAFHDYMRKPGSFAATLRGVKILNDAGINSDLMATVSRQNLEYILSCMDIAAEHHAFGFTFARYCATSPEKAEDSYPTPEEYRDFLLRYYRKAKEYREKGCRTEFLFKEHLFRLLWYELGEFQPTEFSKTHPDVIFDGCHLGQGCTILPNGDVLACRRMDSVIGNIRTESLHTILTGEACQRYAAVKDIKKCRDCELLQWCRGCRAVGYNVSGDLQGEDPCCWKKM